jgi:membrane protease YdiL (CAAX protease family)
MADDRACSSGSTSPTHERAAALALLPVAATVGYYALPGWLQVQPLVQFAPQFIGYLAFALWATWNDSVLRRVGLQWSRLSRALTLGSVTGLLLGGLNTLVILRLVPFLGGDITFLQQTPHARVPMLIMVPWFITMIALFVELHFRGFVLGRLAALEATLWRHASLRRLAPLALTTTSVIFAFDPFMVATFQYLHWIALWDGVVWGLLWLHTRNLYVTIVAHAVEVIVMYSGVRSTVMS